jgi:D-alanine-D-alanine ligase
MIKVAILFGGPGSEHEVSVFSAKNILENIDRTKFDVLEVFMTKDKKYKIDEQIFEEDNGINEIKNRGIEVIFPIIHGEYGEDGELQGKLEGIDIKFVGSPSKSSALTIDKVKTNEILYKNNIKIPGSKVISKEDNEINFTYPIVVKPIDGGSSVDLFKFENEEGYRNSLEDIFKNNDRMLAQEFVSGREFTCGVIEINGQAIPLVATEVVLTKGDLFDYEAKYTQGGCTETTPAEIDQSLMERIKDLALLCHKVLGCRHISRTDVILKDNELYVLEINTVPGMTKTSFIPAQAKFCGYSMKELITILIDSAK